MIAPPQINMLDLDRHLSRVLEQAQASPLSVLRYGRPWVWLLSSDAWGQSLHWLNFDTAEHPLMEVRKAIDPGLAQWPVSMLAGLYTDDASQRALQRAMVLVTTYAPPNAQRLHDDLTYQQVYRSFIGISPADVWPMDMVERLLGICRTDDAAAVVSDMLRAVPSTLMKAAFCPG